MSSLLEKFTKKHIASLNEGREIPDFKAGDTIEVHVRIIEGSNSRIQIFTGACLRRRNSQKGGAGSTFTVKKVSNGEIVERTFLLHSPIIAKIKLLKVGRVRRAKLYYMRYLSGKAARIKELNRFDNDRASMKAKVSRDESKAKAISKKTEKAEPKDSAKQPAVEKATAQKAEPKSEAKKDKA